MSKVVAIVQARMGSTRFPGKVMKKLSNRTVLGHVILRLLDCLRLDKLVIATTTNSSDDIIAQEANKYGVSCFRGSEENVLERYYLAAQEADADIIVRVTSDDPLVDPEIISAMLKDFEACSTQGVQVDYLSNKILTKSMFLHSFVEILLFLNFGHTSGRKTFHIIDGL
jgi:spore coat polysaccharide biosynthesis protein SpsF